MQSCHVRQGTEKARNGFVSRFYSSLPKCRSASPRTFWAGALATALIIAGCGKGRQPQARRSGHVDLAALERLHPAWPERDSLTALIESAHISHQRPIPPFRVPPEPSLPSVPRELGTISPAEQTRMERLIQERIQRDFGAVRQKVEREVARFEETETAAAEKQAVVDAEASAPQFRQQYREIAETYADRIAPRQLEQISLQSQPADLVMMPLAERQSRAQRLVAVQAEITALLAARDEELRALHEHYLADVRAARQRRLADAAARVAQYRAERLADLQRTRERQQAQIQADLERAMRLRVELPPVEPPQPGPTAAAARQRAAATSASALATMDRYHEAAREIEHDLYVQREQLEALILESTRTAVMQLARTHHIDVRFAPATAGPDLTQQFAAWLRERWPATATGRSGVQAFGRSGVREFTRMDRIRRLHPEPVSCVSQFSCPSCQCRNT